MTLAHDAPDGVRSYSSTEGPHPAPTMKFYRITIMVSDNTDKLSLGAAKLFFNGRQFTWNGTTFETDVVEGWEFKRENREDGETKP